MSLDYKDARSISIFIIDEKTAHQIVAQIEGLPVPRPSILATTA